MSADSVFPPDGALPPAAHKPGNALFDSDSLAMCAIREHFTVMPDTDSQVALGRTQVKVLLVGDDQALNMQVRGALGGVGTTVSVTRVPTLRSAEDLIERPDLDAILIDGDAIDARAIDVLRPLVSRLPPIVVLAGDLDQEARLSRDGVTLFHDFLLKTEVEPRALGRSLRHAIVGRQLRRHEAIAGRMEVVGRFASSAIHDLSNLLTIVLAASERMRGALPAGHPVEPDCRTINDSVSRAVALTQQVLSFSRPKPAQPTVFSLGALVSGSETVLRALVGTSVELVTSIAAVHDYIRADPSQVDQVLFNLVANARDALPTGGRVEVETRAQRVERASLALNLDPGPYVVLSVIDSGVGMDAETKAHAFEPFYTTKGHGRGTGLGLSTVYRIVQSWGGEVRIDSAPGVGTTVSVFLPVVEQAALAEPSPTEPRPAAEARSARVLIVEDEEAVGELVVDMLSAEGYQTLCVGGPALALEACHAFDGTIDLLLTDIVMPGMSGIELAQRIRTMRPGIRVLYMSGYSDHTGTSGGFLDEGMRLVSKPFDRRSLLEGVRDALDADPSG